MQKQLILLSLLVSLSISLPGQSIFGTWKTIDDESGEAKSVVEITERNGKVFGKIIKLFRGPGEDPDPLCDECPEDDDRYMQKVIGLEIIRDMEKDDDEYEGGTIMDPENGNIYRCRIWLGEDGNLKVRGYVAFFYRTQTWLPYPE